MQQGHCGIHVTNKKNFSSQPNSGAPPETALDVLEIQSKIEITLIASVLPTSTSNVNQQECARARPSANLLRQACLPSHDRQPCAVHNTAEKMSLAGVALAMKCYECQTFVALCYTQSGQTYVHSVLRVHGPFWWALLGENERPQESPINLVVKGGF